MDAKKYPGRAFELGTVVGLCGAAACLILAIINGGGLAAFVHLSSLAFVLGGSIGAALVSFPTNRVYELPLLIKIALKSQLRPPVEVISEMVRLSEIARRDGMLALDEQATACADPFLRLGLQMTVDGVDQHQMESILSAEIDALEGRHASGRGWFENVGRFAPALGMIGTLIGMVSMLGKLNEPHGIGPAMAGALLTTLYGVTLSNLVALPIADKLARLTREEVINKTIVIRGLMAIQRGDSPRIVEQKLATFLPFAERTPQRRAA